MSIRSERLRSDIAEYQERTGTKNAVFGNKALNDPTLIFDIKKGRKVRVATEDVIRSVMAKYPDGIGDDKASPAIDNFLVVKNADMPEDVERVDRDPCWRCGVRKDKGCNCKSKYEYIVSIPAMPQDQNERAI